MRERLRFGPRSERRRRSASSWRRSKAVSATVTSMRCFAGRARWGFPGSRAASDQAISGGSWGRSPRRSPPSNWLGFIVFSHITEPGVHVVDLLLLSPDESVLALEVKGTLRAGAIPRMTPSRLRQMSREWLNQPDNPAMIEWELEAISSLRD